MRAVRHTSLLLLTTLTLGGCFSPYRAYPGPKRAYREVGYVMVNRLTITEIDGKPVAGIGPSEMHFLPGPHSLVATAAWESPVGVYPWFHKEATNRIYFTILPRHQYTLTADATSSVTVGYSTLVVTGMRILLRELGQEVSRYTP